MKNRNETQDTIWVAVQVSRGYPVEVKAFTAEQPALQQEARWRQGMNIDYDDTGVFAVSIAEKI